MDCGCETNWSDGEILYQGAYFCCPKHDGTYVAAISDMMVFTLNDENILKETKDAILLNLCEEEENGNSWNRYWFPRSQINLTKDEVRIPVWLWESRQKA